MGELWGWQATFLAASGIGVVALAIQMLTLPKLPAAAAPGLASFKAALTRRAVVVGIGTGLLVISGHFAALTFIRPFLEEVPRLDVATVSLALLAFGVSGFFGNLAGGAVAARSPAWAVSSCSFLIAAVALTLILFGTQADVAFVAIALWGFAFGAFPVSISIWNARRRRSRGKRWCPAVLDLPGRHCRRCSSRGLIIDSLDSQAVIVYAAAAAFAGAALMFIRGRAIERQRG
ncbi:MFS transporter [Pseudomonas sp. MDMC_285]|nr:MFS transporter [Pseudomonas sp. MDMC_285]